MKTVKFLKLIGLTAPQQAVNGRNFKTAEFLEIAFIEGFGEVKSNKKASRRNLWDDFTDAEGRTFTADPLYKTGKLGDTILGSIDTFNTTDYHVIRPDGSISPTANTRTLVIFEGENAISIANNQLKRVAACVIDNGQMTAPQNLTLQPIVPDATRLQGTIDNNVKMEVAEAWADFHRTDIEIRNIVQAKNIKEGKKLQQFGASHAPDDDMQQLQELVEATKGASNKTITKEELSTKANESFDEGKAA